MFFAASPISIGGANRDTLLKIHVSLILSRINYGCIVYSSARKSYLRKLDSIHCAGIRLATGAFWTSPTNSLYCESGLSPLFLIRKKLLINYGTNTLAQPNHPNRKFFTDEATLLAYQSRPTISRPTAIRFRENAIQLPNVYPLNYHEVPPWIINLPKCHIDCSIFKKGDIYDTAFQGIFRHILIHRRF